MIDLNVELPDIPCMYYEIDEMTDCLKITTDYLCFTKILDLREILMIYLC